MNMLTIAFGAACTLFAYPFLILPALLALMPRRRRGAEPVEEDLLPNMALIICALNEAKVIRAKMENCLALRYPAGKLRVVVISDGSTDETAAIVREYAARGVELIERTARRGKAANLNDVLPSRGEEILALSDANVMYAPDALLRLAARFEDPQVGCVSGRVILTDSAPELDNPSSTYYSMEWMLQEKTSAIYSMAGADGAMYALRKELFRPCPNDTLIEDFVIPMAVIRQGRRVVFEPNAVGWERGPSSLDEEFRRKVRIAAGTVQALARGNGWPAGAPFRFWFVFVSHKLLRWVSPLTGTAALALAAAPGSGPAPHAALTGFMVLVALAAVRAITGWAHPALSAPFYFLFGQAALAWGILKGLAGRQSVLWAKVNR